MFTLNIFDFIGRFHPLVVHLPIGILLLGCFFQLLTFNSKLYIIRQSIPLIFLFGAVGAIFSTISGYLLSQSGDYNVAMLSIHQWLGISVSLAASLVYFLYKKRIKELFMHITAVLLILLITLTGHYGGTLTHGSGYLAAAWAATEQGKEAIPAIADMQKAIVYTHMVEPLLQKRCYSCHGAEKQKGDLRLDAMDLMLQGGENGKAMIPGNVAESEMIKRLLLPLTDDEHMPPKEKPQLKENEVALLKWWIQEGASADKTVAQLSQTDDIKTMLRSFQQGEEGETDASREIEDLLDKEVSAADNNVLNELKEKGVVVVPIHNGSNYVSISFITADDSENLLAKLTVLEDQLVYLDLSHANVTDGDMQKLSKLKNLLRINLRGTAITDKGLAFFKEHENLKYMNLVDTKVSAKGVEQLKNLKTIQSIYLYGTNLSEGDKKDLQQLFGQTYLDFGGYRVPTLEEDTVMIKE